MTTTEMYAPEAPDSANRAAALAAARHFGTEAIQLNACVTSTPACWTFWAFQIVGRDPRGWNIHGEDAFVSVYPDGTVTVTDGED